MFILCRVNDYGSFFLSLSLCVSTNVSWANGDTATSLINNICLKCLSTGGYGIVQLVINGVQYCDVLCLLLHLYQSKMKRYVSSCFPFFSAVETDYGLGVWIEAHSCTNMFPEVFASQSLLSQQSWSQIPTADTWLVAKHPWWQAKHTAIISSTWQETPVLWIISATWG